MNEETKRIGFACAYTPLPLISAYGYTPYRVLPLTEAEDQAGAVLHDNLCPHVKRLLDRAIADDLPPLEGIVFMNSCDTMRRLGDAWTKVRPEHVRLVDLPPTDDEGAIAYFKGELMRLSAVLGYWSDRTVDNERIVEQIDAYNRMASALERLAQRASRGTLKGGWRRMQELYVDSVTKPFEDTFAALVAAEAEDLVENGRNTPLYLFGNVLADPEALQMFSTWGVRLVGDDLCTGSRQITPIACEQTDDPLLDLARGLLKRPPCARTLPSSDPKQFAQSIISQAKASGARGVIAHVMKFCDPYLARLPSVQEALKSEGLPLLTLEGDCTLRSLGQHKTRVEAFVEMLGGSEQ